MKIITFPNEVLSTPTERVQNISDIVPYLKEMNEIVSNRSVAGLSANQIGVPLDFFIMKMAIPLKGGMFDVVTELVINPYILRKSALSDTEFEGCLSFPGLRVPVVRPLEILVSYKTCDLNGENERTKETTFNRFNARVFQHEYEHGRGITFLDSLKPIKKGLYKDKYKKILKTLKRN